MTRGAAGTPAPTVAQRLTRLLENVTRSDVPLRVHAWDDSRSGPDDALLGIYFRSPRALRQLMWMPNEIGAARAYVNGDIDIEVDHDEHYLDLALADPRLAEFAAKAQQAERHKARLALQLIRVAVRTGALGTPIKAPAEESAITGRHHGRSRDAAAIAHHYDVGNEFYRLFLGREMVYSCAYWRENPRPEYGIEEAQRDKLALVCGKLGLRPGQRLLDVGCGWGSLLIHAARRHEVRAVGVTLSVRQADLARERVRSAGVEDLVEIRLQDYRDISDGPYDAIASVGMAEHVGRDNLSVYAAQMRRLLEPGGRLLHHQITSAHPKSGRRGRFIDRYIFPDGELLPVGHVIRTLEDAGLEARDVESLREHYVLTLHAWLQNLEHHSSRAQQLVTPARMRAWRLYLAGSAAAFATCRIGVHQLLAIAPLPRGESGLPRLRSEWLPDTTASSPQWFDPLPTSRTSA